MRQPSLKKLENLKGLVNVTISTAKRLPLSTILQYALIIFPTAFASIPIYIFIPDFYASSFNISLVSISITLLLLRIIDCVLDPVIGYYSDIFIEYRQIIFPLIFILFCSGFFILCHPIFTNILFNFIVGVFISTFCYSFIVININALGATWSKHEADKYKIISVRESLTILGILSASILPVTLNNYTSKSNSFLTFSVIFIILISVFGTLFMRWIRNLKPRDNHQATPVKLSLYLHHFDQNLTFYFSAYALTAIGSAIPAVMLLFYSQHVLQTPHLSGLYLFLYFFGAILGIPIWRKISAMINLKRTWTLSIFIAIGIFSCAFFLHQEQYILFSIICVLSGICFGAELLLPNTFLAIWLDKQDNRKLANGYYAFLAFLSKLSLAIATVICLPILQKSGFNTNAQNSPHVLLIITLLYTVLPCLFKGSAAIILTFWKKQL